MVRYKDALAKWRREYLLAALKECDGNMRETAKRIGVNRTDLYKLCDRAGIVRIRQQSGRQPNYRNQGNEAWQSLSATRA